MRHGEPPTAIRVAVLSDSILPKVIHDVINTMDQSISKTVADSGIINFFQTLACQGCGHGRRGTERYSRDQQTI
jgi:hypothetical protein